MRRSAAPPITTDWLQVESLDLQGQGVAHDAQGKVVFIEGALAGETVRALIQRRKSAWEQGALCQLAASSPLRVKPACPHFGLHRGACGGCKVQHLEPSAQVAVKQRVLEDNLAHLAKVKAEQILRPIEGPAWAYRHRARLSVRHVAARGVVLVGFHERQSRYVADMTRCAILPVGVSKLLLPLRDLIGSLHTRDRLPQIELAVGERQLPDGSYGPSTALVLRHLQPLPEADAQALRTFAAEHQGLGLQWWLQPGGPDTVHRLDGRGMAGLDLLYRLPEFGVVLPFKPTDFTQVNAGINGVMVGRAVRLLQPQSNERVIDWFCGLGNFTLALARLAAQVLGVEGSASLVERARDNAVLNGCSNQVAFAERNLFEMDVQRLIADGMAQKWLLDPPREGALALCKALADAVAAASPGWEPPQRIVYLSCNPATLARDAGLLVHQAGYRCTMAGVVNMFPHTAHVESMAVFERE
ncbi:MAG: 23S rRNA (uracil(1939)-C(5))-methyltransferase RlmD [Betaproteobacteria bacterium]|nr:23S rRNA (uracil(1939)-C(5))-methyltransferase RlmD [Betaproteobacteria bacterium]